MVSRNVNDSVAGLLPDFNITQSYSWLAFHVETGGTVEGFNPAAFTFDTAGFASLTNPSGIGTFAMQQVGNDVFITFTPVPEPGSVLLLSVLSLGLLTVMRRRVVSAIKVA